MSESLREKASALLRAFKGDRYRFGPHATDHLATQVADLGRQVVVFAGQTARSTGLLDTVSRAVRSAGGAVIGVFDAARPNSPVEDVYTMTGHLRERPAADCVITMGGGSAIDAAKGALVIQCLGGEVETWFGAGLVARALAERQKALLPMIAVMTASSSAAHLTKYSNLTRFDIGQKKLIIDEAIVPPRAVFDYTVTTGMGASFTLDGAFDGISHSFEVYLGVTNSPAYEKIEPIALTGIELILTHLGRAIEQPDDVDARIALGLGTDLGGYCIMTGATNGAHLNSFSLVDILPHGRAVSILNPYYVVFFAPACERPLRRLADLYARAGWLKRSPERLHGRDLGLAVSEAMSAFAGHVGFPTRLADVPGFGEGHIRRCLAEAKNPQLRSKLESMPVRLAPEAVDEYMGSILEAATVGNPALVRNMPA
jgi:alcohol dehydrogenase